MTLLFFVLATVIVLWLLLLAAQAAPAALGTYFGVVVEEVCIGLGPTLCVRQRGLQVWRFKVLPLGGYTRFRGLQSGEAAAGRPEPPRGSIQAASYGVRLLLILVSPGIYLLLGVLLLSIAVLLGDPQLIAEAESRGQPPSLLQIQRPSTLAGQFRLAGDTAGIYLARLLTFQSLQGWGGIVAFVLTASRAGMASAVDWATMMGLAAVTLGCWNLLPIPPLNGFHALHLLVAASLRRPLLPERITVPLVYAGLLLLVALYGRIIWLDCCWQG